jgi:anti-sigma-K factor RskA
MKIHQHPVLLEHLASSYALGTLRGGARRRFETLAISHTSIRHAINEWQLKLGGLNELSPEVVPSLNVWKRIHNLLPQNSVLNTRQAKPETSVVDDLRQMVGLLGARLVWWRRASWSLGLAFSFLFAASFVLLRQARHAADIPTQFVAVLADDKAAESVLVTFDTKTQKLNLQRLSGYSEGASKSLQLWAIDTSPGASGKPQSLGVLGSDAVIRLATNGQQQTQMKRLPLLAVSLEPKGGVPGDKGPTGPVLFKGQLRATDF